MRFFLKSNTLNFSRLFELNLSGLVPSHKWYALSDWMVPINKCFKGNILVLFIKQYAATKRKH